MAAGGANITVSDAKRVIHEVVSTLQVTLFVKCDRLCKINCVSANYTYCLRYSL